MISFLKAYGLSTGVDAIGPDQVRIFLAETRLRTSPGNAALHYRNLHALFAWLIEEGERLEPSPVGPSDRPNVPEVERPPFTASEVRALLTTCATNTFRDRRDLAIMRTFLDTGMRLSAMAGIRYHPSDPDESDVELMQHRLRIRLKAGRIIWVPVGCKAATALDRYIRARDRHEHADSPWLWLGIKAGRAADHLQASGINQMMGRRGRQAGIKHANPHRWRRTMADLWLEGGGNLDDLMQIAGWKGITMPLHYTKERRLARARAAHRRNAPGDRF